MACQLTTSIVDLRNKVSDYAVDDSRFEFFGNAFKDFFPRLLMVIDERVRQGALLRRVVDSMVREQIREGVKDDCRFYRPPSYGTAFAPS